MMKTISPTELYEKIKKGNRPLILDVRAKEKVENDHIREEVELLNIPKTTIFDIGEGKSGATLSLPRDKELIITCTTGNSAKKCATILTELGHEVTLLEGGMTAWNKYKNSLN